MRAWWVEEPGPIGSGPLRLGERPDPTPGPSEVLLSVRACGVCRTDLHLAEGDLRPGGARRIPGHEVVAEVVGLGAGSSWTEAGQALLDLSRDRFTGAAVLLRST
jgi:propanol-preferring alcohol dehydrogenase